MWNTACTHLMSTHRETQRVNIGGRQRVQFSLENGILVPQTAIFPAARAKPELSLAYGSLDSSLVKKG